MANTFTQLPVQFIFAVKKRNALILDPWKDRLQQFITGIVKKNGHQLIQINSMPDHVHLFTAMRPDQTCSELMKRVKGGSSLWINNNLCPETFSWQTGFEAFAYGKSQIQSVVRYIQHQQNHHKKIRFPDEYKKFLDAFDILYDERFIFQDPI
jgi:REP element-mobilizing transposase RayT